MLYQADLESLHDLKDAFAGRRPHVRPDKPRVSKADQLRRLRKPTATTAKHQAFI